MITTTSAAKSFRPRRMVCHGARKAEWGKDSIRVSAKTFWTNALEAEIKAMSTRHHLTGQFAARGRAVRTEHAPAAAATLKPSAIVNPTPPKSPRLAQALQWAAWSIRKKNRAAQANGGQRVPLA